MAKFRAKAFTIEATQWFKDGDHPAVISSAGHISMDRLSPRMVEGAQGYVAVASGDWIIKEAVGIGYYPCSPIVFAAKYEAIDG